MSQETTFGDVLDSAEHLDADSQAELVAVLSRRLAEPREGTHGSYREAQARRDFAAGQC